MWECKWQMLKQTDADMAAFVADLALQDPLHPHDTFYSGCTNAIKLYYHVDASKEIRYNDYTSLCLWVNNTAANPCMPIRLDAMFL